MNSKASQRLNFIINVAYIALIGLLIFLSIKYLINWILPFLLAFFLVTLMHPVIRRVKRLLNIKQEVLSIIAILLLYALVGLLLFFGILQLSVLVQDALIFLPKYYRTTISPTLEQLGNSFSSYLYALPEPWVEQLTNLQSEIGRTLQSTLVGLSQKGISLLSRMTGKIPSFLIGLTFTIMLSFFVSLHYEAVIRFIRAQLSPRAKELVRDTKVILFDTVLKYIKAAFTLAIITFVELTIGLLVLGQKNAIAVAAGIAVFDALPFFGTGAIVIPWALVELLQGNFTLALALGILYATVTFVRNIIEPKVVGDKLGLNPIVSLVSIYFGYRVIGVLGMIIMPILTQILLALHQNGKIHLFRTPEPPEPIGGSPQKTSPEESEPIHTDRSNSKPE